jgi:hypothetical protein
MFGRVDIPRTRARIKRDNTAALFEYCVSIEVIQKLVRIAANTSENEVAGIQGSRSHPIKNHRVVPIPPSRENPTKGRLQRIKRAPKTLIIAIGKEMSEASRCRSSKILETSKGA